MKRRSNRTLVKAVRNRVIHRRDSGKPLTMRQLVSRLSEAEMDLPISKGNRLGLSDHSQLVSVTDTTDNTRCEAIKTLCFN